MDKYHELLKHYWGYDDFRGIQRDIIESICERHDTLGLMPTGGGKSITFQVPALALEGVCIVITPLIALMNDQVQHLRQRGIRAAAIHSGLSHDDILQTLENAIFGGVKLLYVSPERLASDLFIHKLRHMKVSFLCVDEAHCICQWGYDFRPSYLSIADIRREVPTAPVLALTATATPLVVADIQDKLTIDRSPLTIDHSPLTIDRSPLTIDHSPLTIDRSPLTIDHSPLTIEHSESAANNGQWSMVNGQRSTFNVFRMSFERPNLSYVVRHAADKVQQMLHILRSVPGPAIVYTRSRQRTKELAAILCQAGESATFFHAGLDQSVKDQRQRDWQAGSTRIIVATNAFGMGIDKPDVRTVIHADCPDSIEAYFQEAGRAGRDGQRAYAVLLYSAHDRVKLLRRISDTFPEKEEIRQVYDHLAYFYQVAVGSGYNATFEFPVEKFCHAFHHFPLRVVAALKILQRAGYIEYRDEDDNKARLRFCLERDDLYRLRDNPPQEDALIVALLRTYSGLFVDYAYIDEAYLAQQTALTRPQLYLLLKELHRKRIIDYIPQKRTPFIRYMQRREESDQLRFPPEAYDLLKQRFAERIEKMIAYAETDNQCRSRMLLSYFGEDSRHDCRHCDVCLHRSGEEPASGKTQQAREAILALLADGKPHHVSCLHAIPLPYPQLEAALRQLISEETVTDDDGMLCL
ncbi:MAG: DEAD/DEAH box helicase [Prevotella sp.]|nr:DEAD/DEAH box helicase [Prevotella sp.]